MLGLYKLSTRCGTATRIGLGKLEIQRPRLKVKEPKLSQIFAILFKTVWHIYLLQTRRLSEAQALPQPKLEEETFHVN